MALPHLRFHLRVRHFLPSHNQIISSPPFNRHPNFRITMASPSIITLSLVILLSSFVANGIPGGRTKVADVKTNKEIQELGRYTVEEYNRLQRSWTRRNDGELRFSQVVEAEKQVVSGMKYYLKIEAFSKTSGDPKVFEAVVVVKAWLRSKQLLKFSPSPVISEPVW